MSAPGQRSRSDRLVLAAAAALVLAATAFRAWSVQGTWFYYDDFPFIVQAVHHRLTADYLMTPYLGHLMPAGRLFAWLAIRQNGLDYLPFATGIVVGFALAGLGMVRLLVVLFGPRWGVLPPLVVFLFSPLLVETTQWWSAAINQIPALIAITWGLAAYVCYLRSGRNRHLAASLAWVLFGLAFAELALLTYVFFVVIALTYFASGTLVDRARAVWTERRRGVVAHLGLIAAYLAVYVPSASERLPPGKSHPLLGYLYDMGAKAFATTAVGGPLTWHWAWAAQIEVAPSDLLLVLSWAVLAALLFAARQSRTRALRATILLVVLLAAKVLLVSTGRGVFGPAFALDVRFAYDLAPAYALCLGLAFMPVRQSTESSSLRQRHPLIDNPRVVAGVVAIFVVLSAVSTARFPLRQLGMFSPQAYVTHLRSSLAQTHGSVPMAAGAAVPIWVFGGVEGRFSNFLPLVSDRFSFPTVAADRAYVTDGQGFLVPAQLTVARREDSARAHPAGCPFPGERGRVTIPLDGPVFGVGWLIRIDYRASSAAPAVVATGDLDTKVDLSAGSHWLLLPASATYDEVELRSTDPSLDLCVDHVEVGTLSADR